MTENTENLVLEHLKHIRSKVDRLADDVDDLKMRVGTLENEVRHGFFHTGEALSRQQAGQDRIAKRLERIENRLDLEEHR